MNFHFQGPEMPRSIALRDALEVDIPLIEMWAQAIDSGQYMSRHLPQLPRTLLWKIIIVDGTDVGTTWIERREGSPEAVFLGIFIGLRSALGKGIGRGAIAALIDEVRRSFGDLTIHLHVRQTNARAIACYQHCGFVQIGVNQKVLDDGVVLSVVTMALRASSFSHPG